MHPPSALECPTRTGVVDQYATHHPRGQREELGAALPMRILLTPESQPRLVHECGWLQRVTLALASQREPCLPAKLLVDEPHERVACVRLARAPRTEKFGHHVSRGLR